jgi:hypothetical protein
MLDLGYFNFGNTDMTAMMPYAFGLLFVCAAAGVALAVMVW